MKASVVDLRYRMKDVLHALDRNEEVTVLHRGKVRGTIVPTRTNVQVRVVDHPFFGSEPDSSSTVDEEMEKLRGGRFSGI